MLGIGRGLMSNAEMLMVDEPALGLAPVLVQEVYATARQDRPQRGHRPPGRGDAGQRAGHRRLRLPHGDRPHRPRGHHGRVRRTTCWPPPISATRGADAWTHFVQALISGLVFGAIYAIMTMGLTLVYGCLRTLNMAQGAFGMVGGYAAWVITTDMGAPPIVGLVVGALAAGRRRHRSPTSSRSSRSWAARTSTSR